MSELQLFRAYIQRETWRVGPYAGIDRNLDFNTCTIGNPIPESTLTLCQSRLYSPVRDLGLSL